MKIKDYVYKDRGQKNRYTIITTEHGEKHARSMAAFNLKTCNIRLLKSDFRKLGIDLIGFNLWAK